MTFVPPKLAGDLRPIVETAFGYSINDDPAIWQWTDITKYVRGSVWLSAGAQDQGQDADPSQIRLDLDNTDGRFTSLNPNSPYWPNVKRNVPLRVSITWAGATGVYELLTAFVDGWPLQPQAGVISVWTPITASGRLRRLRASSAVVVSALRKSVPAYAPVRAYWPLEKGDLQSPISGVADARMGGSAVWQTPDGLPGSDTLPVLAADSTFSGYMSGTSTTSNGWQADFYMMVPSAPGASVTLMRANMPPTSGQAAYQVDLTGTTLTVSSRDGFGAVLNSATITPIPGFLGAWQHLRLTVAYDVPTTKQTISLATLPVDGSTGLTGTTGPILVGPLWAPVWLSIPRSVDLAGVQFGHPYVSDGVGNTGVDGAGGGWAGELATARVARICAENGIPVTVIG